MNDQMKSSYNARILEAGLKGLHPECKNCYFSFVSKGEDILQCQVGQDVRDGICSDWCDPTTVEKRKQ